MARIKASGPRGKPRSRPGGRRTQAAPQPSFEGKYPNLAALERGDREEHRRRARQMGATGRQAARHADLEVGGH